ncbi:MAG: PIN domain protein [Coriobacteriia bacterium]|nr:PIN domain protein [Coriobacteriia bacterium]
MRIYLDNCCFNRLFNDQSNVRNRLETDAKLHIQSQISGGTYEIVWSYVFEYDNSVKRYVHRCFSTLAWKSVASVRCLESSSIIAKANAIKESGVRTKDALHISCAIESGAKYLIATDDGLLRKSIEGITVINPIDFVRKEAGNDL